MRLNALNLAQKIESTLLASDMTEVELNGFIQESIDLGVLGVCVPPFWVKKVSRDLSTSSLQVVTVVGFPTGYQLTETKLREADLALEGGADELDVVMNVSAFKSQMNWAKIELAQMARLVHSAQKIFKVIIECPVLNQAEMAAAVKVVVDSGADFLKTSTGTLEPSVQSNTVTFLKGLIPDSVGLKVAGGIRTREQAIGMLEVGADRIGTSSAKHILV